MTHSSRLPTLIVMAKAPAPGRVKTRLEPALGPLRPAELYEGFLRDVLRTSHCPARWNLVLAYWPVSARMDFERLVETLSLQATLEAQNGDDLSARMRNLLSRHAGSGEPVVMRNSDSPQLASSRLEEAFERLRSPDDIVFGPDRGGGYYLVGMLKWRAGLFETETSVPSNYKTTTEGARRLGYNVTELPAERDLDTPEDLRDFEGEIVAGSISEDACPETVRILRAWGRISRR